MAITWTRGGKTVFPDCQIITYFGLGTSLEVQSRKRQVPHNGRSGTWEFTSYFVVENGREIKELYSLKEAKEYAEEYWKGKEKNESK